MLGSLTITPPSTYALTVTNGTGSGSYAANTQVSIDANTAPAGKLFDKWITSGGSFASENSANTTFTMPASNATIEATYIDVPAKDAPVKGAPSGYTKQTLIHTGTGVSATGSFADSASLNVREISLHADGTCTACDEIRVRQAAGEVVVLYDIAVIGDYQGRVVVSIPVGTQYIGQNVTIYHCASGTLEKVAAIVDGNGNVVGTFAGFSPFAVMQEKTAVSITGLSDSYTLYTGGRVRWTPAPMGGTWEYDSDYLSMTKDGDTYAFTALKEGKTTASYTVNGKSHAINIIINKATLPQTGDRSNNMLWPALFVISMGGIGVAVR